MSLVKQLIEEIEDINRKKPKWKLMSEEYPEPSKIKYIYAFRRNYNNVRLLRSHVEIGLERWVDDFSYSKSEILRLYPIWREILDYENPPQELIDKIKIDY